MQVDPAELHKKAAELDKAADTAETALSETLSSAAKARAGFPGKSAAAFDEMIARMRSDDKELIAGMRQIAEQMRNAAADYTKTDYDNSSQF